MDESWKRVFDQGSAGRRARLPSDGAASWFPCAAPRRASRRTWPPALSIPVATSQRTIAVKVMDENRRIINQHRTLVGQSKISYTHLIGWAIVKALEDFPT